MAGEVTTDAQALQTAADEFKGIAGDLDNVIKQAESIAGGLADSWEGVAKQAAIKALDNFREAGTASNKALDGISESVQNAGIQYTQADQQQADEVAAAAAQMNLT